MRTVKMNNMYVYNLFIMVHICACVFMTIYRLAVKTVSWIKGFRVLSIGFRDKSTSYASFSQRN